MADTSSTDEIVRNLTALLQSAKSALDQSVAIARSEGLSWERIGDAARLTRQSAHERWRWVDEIRTDDAA